LCSIAGGTLMQWLRLYDDVLDDPKVQKLSAAMFRHWVNLLCLANKGSERGRIPHDFKSLAYRLRVTVPDAKKIIETLKSSGLLEENGASFVPHRWDERQKKSDTSAERVARLREKERNSNVTKPFVKRDSNALDTDTDTEQNTPPVVPPPGEPKPRAKTVRKKQVPDDWMPSQALYDWALGEAFSRDDVFRETPKFIRHHRSKGNTFSDVGLAWQNWMERSRDFSRPARASPSGVPRKTTTDLILEAGRRVQERHDERERHHEDAGDVRRGVRPEDEGSRAQLGPLYRGVDDGPRGHPVDATWRERG
jgi:hypothetical protein